MSRILPRVARGAVLALALFGCAEERKPINKVQPNALAKKFFAGDLADATDDPTFYFRNFVVDASESQELIGVGSFSGIDRVRWEITEDTLYARRAYPQNPGADDKGYPSSVPNGTIVAAYDIESHFDVKRAYNPQTGEELNVIEENTTDRPWYQRDYFRVDWSENKVDSPQWTDMFIGKLTGEIKVTPVAYAVTDPDSEDAPHFEPEDGYFDVTSKFLVEPTASRYQGLPQCVVLGIYTGTAIQNCDAQEAVVRSSYYRVDRVDADSDFEPFENTRAPSDIVGNPGGIGDSLTAGYLTPPRVTWDPGYGYVDPGLVRYLNIHEIWQKSHQTRGECTADADCRSLTKRSASVCLPSGTCSVPCSYAARADANKNGTDDQCENSSTGYRKSPGSQCSARDRCTIPYRDRTVKPIAYWVTGNLPDDLQDSVDSSGKKKQTGPTEDVIFTWSQAIGLAIAHAREVECRKTGGDRAGCHSLYFDTRESEMVSYGGWGIDRVKDRSQSVVVCHNPVRDYDPEVCGERGSVARIGDVRKHFINYWPYESRAPWAGIGNWIGDPLTGRIIGAAATVMGRSVTRASAQIRDILMVANGELDLSEITDGVPAQRFQERLRFGEQAKALGEDEILRRVKSVDTAAAAAQLGGTISGSTALERILAAAESKAHTSADPGLVATAVAESDAIAKPLLGSQYEAGLVDPTWLVDSMGLSPTSVVDDSVLNQASPIRGRDPWKIALARRSLAQDLAYHGVCDFGAADGVGNGDIRGVARFFGDKVTGRYSDDAVRAAYPDLASADATAISDARGKLIYDDLVRETYKGILLHEVGHTLGLFHNFASSYDSVNYNPQYWQLRTNEGQATASCADSPRTGTADTCMGPRFVDAETDDELGQGDESRPGINYFANTSTMEYQTERFFEGVGLGQYDVMAMGAFYGRVLETYDDKSPGGVSQGDQQNYVGLSASQLIDDLLVDWTTPYLGRGIQPMHYTELARRLKVFDPGRCRAATDDEIARARWRIVHGKVCSPPPKDYAAWDDFVNGSFFSSGDVTRSIVSPDAAGGTGNVRWPYRFGQTTDAYIHINPDDSGADSYEVVHERVKKFDYNYPFVYFRRQRRAWDYEAIPSLDTARFFERLRSYHWVLSRDVAAYADPAFVDDVEGFKTNDDVMRARLLAETEMIDSIARAVVTPQIGDYRRADPSYQLGSSAPLYDANSGNRPPLFTLDASTARFVDPDYDTGPSGGGSWDYPNWVTRAGFYVEKGDAAFALVDPRPTLAVIQRDTYMDGRALYISFRTDLSRAVDRLLGGMIAGDWEGIAGSVPADGDTPEYMHLADEAPARVSGSRLLFPNLGYLQQLDAIVFGQIFSRLGTDLTLANKMLVYLEGTEGVIDVPDAEKIKFTDPRSGYTYVARKYGDDVIDGRVVDKGIGSRLLARANDLLGRLYQVETDASGAPVIDAFGRPTLVLGTDGQPVAVGDSTVSTGFQNHVGLVDTMTQVARLVGHGPL